MTHTQTLKQPPAGRRMNAIVQTGLSPVGHQVVELLRVGWEVWREGRGHVWLMKAEGVGSVKTVKRTAIKAKEVHRLVRQRLIEQKRTIEYCRGDTTQIFGLV